MSLNGFKFKEKRYFVCVYVGQFVFIPSGKKEKKVVSIDNALTSTVTHLNISFIDLTLIQIEMKSCDIIDDVSLSVPRVFVM